MRLTGKRIVGLAAIAYAIYLIIDVFTNPEGLGPVFRDWWSPSPQEAAAPAGGTSDVPTPTNPLNK